MKTYMVTHQEHNMHDGQVEVVEAPYSCSWNPEKITLEGIGNAAAAERTCGYGFESDGAGGRRARIKCIALATREIEPEQELALG